MSFLDLTPGSTGATDNAVKLYMPPEHAARVLAYLDMVPNPAKARQDRTRDIEGLVIEALKNVSLHAALMAVHQCYRVGKVRDHMRDHPERYEGKVPCIKTVKAILIKQGYYI